MSLYLRLEATGLEPLPLTAETGYCVTAFDPGDNETRVVVEPYPDADDVIDTTQFTGQKAITLSLTLVPVLESKEVMRRKLRAFTDPTLRPYLYMSIDGLPEVRAALVRGPFSSVIDRPGRAIATVQWRTDGFEDVELTTRIVYAGGGSTAGRTYPLTYPRTYPASAPEGTGVVANIGNRPVKPFIRLYGPFTDPVISNVTTNKTLTFAGLTVAAGDFLEVDTINKTLFLNGDPALSYYDKLVFPDSEWWVLTQGDNMLRFVPLTYTAGVTYAEVNWRNRYW